MNAPQRLYSLCAIVAGLLMILFAPFLVYGDQEGQKWIHYAPIWDAPYPSKGNPYTHTPYCPEGHAFYLLLLVQLVVLVIGSSHIHERLGKMVPTYPEYYRP